ncbi:MAG: hypothetical protein ABI640_12920 [Gammaproteobacteria bacterium]
MSELKERMTFEELMGWMAYSEEMGPINPILRLDAAVARAVAPFVGVSTRRQMMPFPKTPEKEASIEEFMGILKGAKVVKETIG